MDLIRVVTSWVVQAIGIAVPVLAATALLVWLRYAADELYLWGLGAAFGAAAIWLTVRWFNRQETPPDAR
jgi:hypothetical protein